MFWGGKSVQNTSGVWKIYAQINIYLGLSKLTQGQNNTYGVEKKLLIQC